MFLPEGSARDGSRWDGLKGMVPLGSGIAPGSAALGSPLPPLAPIATPAGQEGSPAVTGEGRAAAGNRRAPSLIPQPLQPPKSISSSPLSILMNRKGSWDPLRQQPWRLNPPKEQIPKQLALQGSAELVEVPHSSVAVKLFTGIVFLREPCPGYTWWLRLPAPLVHALKKKPNHSHVAFARAESERVYTLPPSRKQKGSETEFLLQDPLQFLEDIFGKGRVVFTLAADSAPIYICMENLHSPTVSRAPLSAEHQPRW